MLDKQYNLYMADTSHFYSNKEKYLHDKYCTFRKECKYISSKIKELKKSECPKSKYSKLTDLLKYKNKKAKETKEKLTTLLANKFFQNNLTLGKDHTRILREEELNCTDIISAFDSALSRTIGISQNVLTDALIIVQIYYFDIFKDILYYGFKFKNEKYIFITSSAGQIRTKKAVFIKESIWKKIKDTIMCGLTIDKINSKGGNNVNKHLAYLALSNSATDNWTEFNIDKSIVIDDFETNVYGKFDFVDETDYSITRKSDYIPIPHTDGAGMMLPSVSEKNFMFRAPWIKGLLGVFDFRKFIEVNALSPVISDIYGKKHNIIDENIEIIFTKSQFKMYKYYNSWDEYKYFFKKYKCSAGKCNIEEDRIKNAKINYQMLQTLTDITDEEIKFLTHSSCERLNNICTCKDTIMEILGVTPYNTKMTPFQKAVKIYPSLINDTYTKDIIRDLKNSLIKKYRSGKLEIKGKYTFILPDFYAACEYWFGHIENPQGLLNNNEVFCSLYRKYDKLDCLRSPHLYKEHAVRNNTAFHNYNERSEKIAAWFTTNGLYASSHDLISKLLMYDVDGDKSLVVADRDFVKIAERNMKDIVPLYYNMKKAEPALLNSENIYNGLIAAFTGGNIGMYSNEISKIWNDNVFITGSKSEKQEAIDCIKRLCCQNNFVIDYAKTLYKPEFPDNVKKQISKYTNSKLPAFFEYAKDKEKSQIEDKNESFVNKIYDIIPNKTINMRNMDIGEIEYHKLMCDKNIICSKETADLYNKLNTKYRYMISLKDESKDNLKYTAAKLREEFAALGYTDGVVSDMLVEYLYGGGKRYKQLLWFCYGQYIIDNLEKNINVNKTKYIQCIDCDEWIEIDIMNKRTCRCNNCQKIHKREYERIKKQRRRQKLI